MYVRTASERDLEAVRALLVETWHDTYDAIYGAEKVTEITDSWHSIASLKARLARPHVELVQHHRATLVGGDGEGHAGDLPAIVGDKEFGLRPVEPCLQRGD